MPLRFEDRWIWDFWFAHDGNDYHIFYLQAPRSLVDEAQRHWNVSVGHAVSQDLRTWRVLPDALAPSDRADGWDSYTTWTGSIVRHDRQWVMFYTGTSRAERGLIQRIGAATSDDLITWTRSPHNPVIEANPTWYELLDTNVWYDQSWRDPFVFWHDGQWHVLISARRKNGPDDGRGCIAHAASDDLRHWQVQPPVTPPGEFGEMEVPQIAQIGTRYYLLFSTPVDRHSAARRARLATPPVGGTHYLVAEHPLGPYRYVTDTFLVGDTANTLYSGKFVRRPGSDWTFMAFRNFDADGKTFLGDIIDPVPVEVTGDGRLLVRSMGARSSGLA